MKCEIDIPTPRFKVGDVIRKPNRENDGAHILRIVHVEYQGSWTWTETGPIAWEGEGWYFMEVCEGSVYDSMKKGDEVVPRADIGAAAVHKIVDVDAIARKDTP